MPGFDGTGPLGFGPMTGWGRGYCVAYLGPHPNRLGLRGSPWYYGGRFQGGLGRGRGRGWRHWYYATGLPGWARAQYSYPPFSPAWGNVPPPSPQEEVEMLKEQSEILKQQLEQIDKRIGELQKNTSNENL